jgi:hypothetical protein
MERPQVGVWPDWSGRAVAIVASGPSTKKAGVEHLEGRITTLAIKQNVDICPWAEVVYGCDYPWWRHVRGLPEYRGLKLCYDARAEKYGCGKVEIPKANEDGLLFGKTGTVGAGGNSGFQAINLAVQFGATRLLLVGFDCQDRSGVHWYGRNMWQGGGNPSGNNFRRWIKAFGDAAKVLAERGVDVVNASPLTDLQCFRRQSITDTLIEWGL